MYPETIMRSFTSILVVCLTLGILGGCQTPDTQATRWAGSYFAKEAITDIPPVSSAEAKVVQAAFVEALHFKLGGVVGYKAGLTSAAAQERFGVDHPVRGVLLENMLLPSGTTLSASFGARPMFEGDLLVRVGDAAINTAETDTALAASLDAVLPFIELPDLLYAPSIQLNGPALTAINVGARLGVSTTPFPLAQDTTALDQLGAITLDLITTEGDTLAQATSTALLGHPIHVVRWLRDTLREDGITLKSGDLLSLGSMTPLFPPEPGQTVIGRYRHLPTVDSVDVVVTFD